MENLGLFKVVKVYQYANVYVCENGKVAYAATDDGIKLFPYRHINGYWIGRSRDCTLSSLRHGIKRGTIKFM